jgi:hypothetical protein
MVLSHIGMAKYGEILAQSRTSTVAKLAMTTQDLWQVIIHISYYSQHIGLIHIAAPCTDNDPTLIFGGGNVRGICPKPPWLALHHNRHQRKVRKTKYLWSVDTERL